MNSFLGMPSSGGIDGFRAGDRSAASQLPAGGNFDVNRDTVEGPRGGQVGGVTATGPRGNTVGRAVGVGPEGGVAAARGVEGAGGTSAVRGAAAGPDGRRTAVGAVRGPEGGATARRVAVGPEGVAAGFARVSPSGRYTCAAAVRSNYDHWGLYGRGWYAQYPGAWLATGWAAGTAWEACAWNDAAAYCGYADAQPVYYDYGNNITYEDNSVYVNGNDVGTSQQYYEQAANLATTGAEASAPAEGDWLPLGVFALAKTEDATSDVSLQLAVNKQGVIRGNSTDTTTNKNQVIKGSVDKTTQKVAFTVGDDMSTVVETGLYNLTKDESPCLIHFGADKTEQWLLVRVQKPDTNTTPAN